MSEKSNTTDTPVPLGEIEHGPSQFEQFMDKNLKKILLLGLFIILGVGAYIIVGQLKEAKERNAGNVLLAAKDADAYRKLQTEFPESNAANSATLLLADQLWSEGKEDDAIQLLRDFTSNSEHPSACHASFALASMLLKQEKTAEAQAAYEAVLSNAEAKHLHPLTLIALGDLARATGNDELARNYYNRKIEDFPNYVDQSLASTRLNLIGIDAIPRVAPPTPDPEVTPETPTKAAE